MKVKKAVSGGGPAAMLPGAAGGGRAPRTRRAQRGARVAAIARGGGGAGAKAAWPLLKFLFIFRVRSSVCCRPPQVPGPGTWTHVQQSVTTNNGNELVVPHHWAFSAPVRPWPPSLVS